MYKDYNFSIKSRDKFKSWYIPEWVVVNSGTSLYVTMTLTLRTTSFPESSLLLPRESRERTLGTRLQLRNALAAIFCLGRSPNGSGKGSGLLASVDRFRDEK